MLRRAETNGKLRDTRVLVSLICLVFFRPCLLTRSTLISMEYKLRQSSDFLKQCCLLSLVFLQWLFCAQTVVTWLLWWFVVASCICNVNYNCLRIDFGLCLWLPKQKLVKSKRRKKKRMMTNAHYRASALWFPHDVASPATPVTYCLLDTVLETTGNHII